ncbi:MAG: PD40 domain-containing protein [Bdellovibrio sp.]|nr:PD40 domain-containing protein [Bdellovibrio sp.]
MNLKHAAVVTLALLLVSNTAPALDRSQAGTSNPAALSSLAYNPFPDADPLGRSPYWDWKTLESAHFRVTFPSELRETAVRSLELFEEAHHTLSTLFQWEAETKTQVVVMDNADSSNGATAAVARFGIILWATPPDSWDSIAYYDDWLRFLVFHEYTHFLNMDTRGGLWKAVRYVFGDVGLPNSTWAPWMLEGLAVYMETRHTQLGRGRSPYYDMVLRAAVQEGVLDSDRFVTLDKITGNNPYFPGGDTRYQFGYQLMNEASNGSEETLGDLSKYSGSSVPLFINTQLKAVAGRTWYQTWKDWLKKTENRALSNLERIRSAPVTSFENLTPNSHSLSKQALGPRVSPDGKVIAYSLASTRQRPGLYKLDLATGEETRLEDKLSGVGLAFTPDSKTVIFSALRQSGQYYNYSDLMAYNLENDSSHWLTRKARLKDPDISPDGKWVVAALSEGSVTGLGILPLTSEKGHLSVGSVQKLFMPARYDRAASPRFSKDGQRVYFSLHKNGEPKEDLYQIEIATRRASKIYSDGFFNRFPTVSGDGSLYFISDRTGVDNLFRLQGSGNAIMVSNVETGIRFPAFPPGETSPTHYYASLFSTAGWNLVRLPAPTASVEAEKVTLSPPPAPAKSEINPKDQKRPPSVEYKEYDYSPFPSIYPRLWSPFIAGISSSGIALGFETFGFDAIDRHRYSLGTIYNFPLNNFDAWALYSNRSFGPSVSVSTDWTLGLQNVSGITVYSRTLSAETRISYPFLWTFSGLTPFVSLNFQRFFNYGNTVSSLGSSPNSFSENLFSFGTGISYSNTQKSTLAVGTERGFSSSLRSQFYLLPQDTSAKVFFQHSHFFPVFDHVVINPSIKGIWSSTSAQNYVGANANLVGRNVTQVLNPFIGNGISGLAMRGYPGITFATRSTAVASLDLRIPLVRVFRGLGTFPAFFDNLYAVAFADGGVLNARSDLLLVASGGGFQLSTELFSYL